MALQRDPAPLRVAMISLHTSPLDPPGVGDSGGMNVYVRSVAQRLAQRGVAVDVFTRCEGRAVPEVQAIGGLHRVIQVPAGPCAPVPKENVATLLPDFSRALLARRELEGIGYDVVHAHYWLSGFAGEVTKARWGVPLVASFHTLGRVKNRVLDEVPRDHPQRLRAEHSVIADADRIVAPTPAESAHLVELYGADPMRIRLVPPGVDLDRFRPRESLAAKAVLGFTGHRVALFVGRLQKLKGPDLAIRTVAEAIRTHPRETDSLVLLLVGGPSGGADRTLEVTRLMELSAAERISDRVHFLPPVPHEELPRVYAAADVLLAPSRSESFGLVALEAQACGIPVVASAVGGLPYVVDDGESGLLVPGEDPRDYAERVVAVLSDGRFAARLSANGANRAAGFSWELTTDRLMSVYSELAPVAAASSGMAAASLAR